jgi:hypothetical protein
VYQARPLTIVWRYVVTSGQWNISASIAWRAFRLRNNA